MHITKHLFKFFRNLRMSMSNMGSVIVTISNYKFEVRNTTNETMEAVVDMTPFVFNPTDFPPLVASPPQAVADTSVKSPTPPVQSPTGQHVQDTVQPLKQQTQGSSSTSPPGEAVPPQQTSSKTSDTSDTTWVCII